MDLGSKTWGGTDQAYKTLITKPETTSTIGSGYQLQDGEGTALPIYVGPDGFGAVNGSGFRTIIATTATSNRTVTFPDSSGTVRLDNYAILAADVTNSTTTGSAISSFGATLEVSSLYEFEIVLRVRSAATTTGYQFQITGPTGEISYVVYEVGYMVGATLTLSNVYRQTLTALATNIAATSAPVAATDYLVQVKGILKTTASTPSGPIGITFQSEVAASQVTTREGSYIRFRKIN